MRGAISCVYPRRRSVSTTYCLLIGLGAGRLEGEQDPLGIGTADVAADAAVGEAEPAVVAGDQFGNVHFLRTEGLAVPAKGRGA